MVDTRAQLAQRLLNGASWPRLSEEMLARLLAETCHPYPELASLPMFNCVLVQFQRLLQRQYGPDVTLIRVKKRVKRLRQRFTDFQEYIAKPGVRFIRETKRVQIEPEYWANFGPNGQVITALLVSLNIIGSLWYCCMFC